MDLSCSILGERQGQESILSWGLRIFQFVLLNLSNILFWKLSRSILEMNNSLWISLFQFENNSDLYFEIHETAHDLS